MRTVRRSVLTATVLGTWLAAAGAAPAAGEDKPVDLKKGDAAPAFTGTDHEGKAWKSADHVGKKVLVVYFFPAAFTGG
jgi:peroxiredoxin Q/BCP